MMPAIRQFVRIFLLSALIVWSAGSLAAESATDVYQKGLQLYQSKDYAAARDQFKSAWQLEPASAMALYNWGLAEAQLGNPSMALAAWRKALYLRPDLLPAQAALDFVLAQSSVGAQLAADPWESFRQNILMRFSMTQGLFVSLILLLAAGWLGLKFAGQYRLALREELPLPPVPWVAILLTLAFLTAQTLSGVKIYDHFQPRATVIVPSTQVRSVPNAEGTALFEVMGGSEVLVKRKNGDWSQVKYPGGLTGWIETQNLFHTSGREL